MKSVWTKIILAVTTVCTLISLIAIGAFAATQGVMSGGGNISFRPDDVFPPDRGPNPLPIVIPGDVENGDEYYTSIVDNDLTVLQNINGKIYVDENGNKSASLSNVTDIATDNFFTLRIPENITINGEKIPLVTVDNNALSPSFNVDTLIIPKTVTFIGQLQFLGNTRNLTRVILLGSEIPQISYLSFPYSAENDYVIYVPKKMEKKYVGVMTFSPPYPEDYSYKEWLNYEFMLNQNAPFTQDNGKTQKRLAVIENNDKKDLKFFIDNDYLK